VRLINDLEATATGVTVLNGNEIDVLQAGEPAAAGNAAVVAAGTGFGAAALCRVNGRLTPMPSETGHADFAARTDRELALVRMLRDLFGRAEVEQVLSGPGIVHLHRFTHQGRPCAAVPDVTAPDAPALISEAGLESTCASCVEALAMFVEAYGAEAGNVGLRALATAGVYLGGGIAPKILPALRDARFLRAFRDKAPMTDLMARMPVMVILNPETGLIGAAVAAQRLL
jgi:glucokinase